jgi:hypothetical protein
MHTELILLGAPCSFLLGASQLPLEWPLISLLIVWSQVLTKVKKHHRGVPEAEAAEAEVVGHWPERA